MIETLRSSIIVCSLAPSRRALRAPAPRRLCLPLCLCNKYMHQLCRLTPPFGCLCRSAGRYRDFTCRSVRVPASHAFLPCIFLFPAHCLGGSAFRYTLFSSPSHALVNSKNGDSVASHCAKVRHPGFPGLSPPANKRLRSGRCVPDPFASYLSLPSGPRRPLYFLIISILCIAACGAGTALGQR